MLITCTICNLDKSLDEFDKRRNRPKGIQSACTSCRKVRDKANWNANKGRETKMKVNFGIDLEEYNQMLNDQGGVCHICKNKEAALSNVGKTKHLAVDHCHTTGEVRGLLCQACNMGLGYFKDDCLRLEAAVRYLNKEGI